MNNTPKSLISACLIASTTLTAGCSNIAATNDKQQHGHHQSANELAKHLDAADRDRWQKPGKVIARLGNIEGKTILDIGAGTGYFSLKLARAGARVIAADVDPAFINIIQAKQQTLAIPTSSLTTRVIPFDSPGVATAEVDTVLIVDTYHHIEHRIEYFAKVKEGLKPGGKLVVVDYKKDPAIDDGPPLSMRLTPARVKDELQSAGFINININTTLLPKQYIIEARKRPDTREKRI